MNKKQPSPPPVAVFRGDTSGWRFNINSCEQSYRNLFVCTKFKMKTPIVSPRPLCVLGFKFSIYHNELWVEQFPRIELQQKWKEASGKYSDRNWTRRIEGYL
jgi:hypothetical protein